MLELSAIWKPETQQQLFRALLNAMARPGSRESNVIPADGEAIGLPVLAVLVDAAVTLADPHQLLRKSDWSLLQAAEKSADTADYIFCDGNRAPEFSPKLGTLTGPEQSATLIVSVSGLNSVTTRLKLKGPGIAESTTLVIDGLDPAWIHAREDWVCEFPLGVDLILVSETQLAAIPRTTNVEVL
ncbi:MAG: phosphonate C-P lyase system protein PhnH [Desulfuromonadales bacterium]|nr:phosphonate C-P lyase system protein PhnH [Desulfuromonadales bacterium]